MSVNYTSTFKTTLKSVVVVKPEQKQAMRKGFSI